MFLDLFNGKVKWIGREQGSLYLIEGTTNDGKLSASVKSIHMTSSNKKQELWHMRLGHPSFTVMKHIPELQKHIGAALDNNCHIFPLAKQTRVQFPLSSSKTSFIF